LPINGMSMGLYVSFSVFDLDHDVVALRAAASIPSTTGYRPEPHRPHQSCPMPTAGSPGSFVTGGVQAGLTQREMAKRLTRPASFVHKSEVGERRIHPLEFVEWCRVCGINPGKAINSLD